MSKKKKPENKPKEEVKTTGKVNLGVMLGTLAQREKEKKHKIIPGDKLAFWFFMIFLNW
ncbi:hypothetical protein [Ferruginibacter albus]|uniref:hypothetical protein n=1 Tax=Ferruginibacter albus TaxID=2875540 RepID=UPI001CC60B84|nr:hypothetical protein [Ferruginibacter albus]UAY53432.1 hypothetical protein K9M53_07100 [Ferruginibacter albus]